ncbi:topoisomerase 6 subunit A [Perkinsela sp. CCAP 1560/4]|nr:topoisomerase 6 subunit A [Perkinsela sp. CCAP 1560/4]|eukprot:KNH05658.1 topoisomerase 6 subunit A [Perkinsela sp. CCAP 1560/4]
MYHELAVQRVEEKVEELLEVLSSKNPKTQHKLKNTALLTLKLIVLDIIHSQLKSDVYCSLRDVYYQVSPFFAVTQRRTDKTVSEIASELELPRHVLRIVPASRGYAAGRFVFRGQNVGVPSDDFAAAFDTLETSTTNSAVESPYVISIPGDFCSDDISHVHGKYLLIIEKDAIFQRVAHHRYVCHDCSAIKHANCESGGTCYSALWQKLDLICVTGCGFPDLATQSFVHCLVNKFKMIPLGLVDYNPFGIRILTTYRNSRLLPLKSKIGKENRSMKKMNVDIHWLGLHGKDIFEEFLLETDHGSKSPIPLMKLSYRDKTLIKGILEDPEVPCAWKGDIQLYMTCFKAELQSLYHCCADKYATYMSQETLQGEDESNSTIQLLKYIESQILGYCYF